MSVVWPLTNTEFALVGLEFQEKKVARDKFFKERKRVRVLSFLACTPIFKLHELGRILNLHFSIWSGSSK